MTWQEHAAPVWCDPPTTRAPRHVVWRPLLAPLMDRPGVWAMIRTYNRADAAYQAVGDLRRAGRGEGRAAAPRGRWEFCSGQVTPDVPEWGVWARYLGSLELSTAQYTDTPDARAEVTA